MSKHVERIKELYRNNKKSSLIWYLTLRGLVILTMVLRFLRGDFASVFLCILTLILFTVPFWINHKFKIEIPNVLEIIILLLKILKETHLESSKVMSFKRQRIVIESDETLLCNVDGEIIKDKRFEFGILPNALTLTKSIPQYVKNAIKTVK